MFFLLFIMLLGCVFLGVFFGFLFTSDSYDLKKDYNIFLLLGQIVVSSIIALPISLILVTLNHYVNDGYINPFHLLPVVFLMTLLISYLLEKPPPPFNYKKEIKVRKKQLSQIFQEFSPIVPNEEIKNGDITLIKKKIGELLTNFSFGDNEKISEKDATHFNKMINFMGFYTSMPSKQISVNSTLYNFLTKAAKTLEIPFISYSPDGKFFMFYLSFKQIHNSSEIDTSKIYFGEKLGEEIHIFQYRGFFKYTREADVARFKFFTGWDTEDSIMYNLDIENLPRVFNYPKCNPMDPLFWEDPNFFDSIAIDGIEYARFKTFKSKTENNDYPYKLREKLVIK